MIRLDRAACRALVEHCRAALPEEACGYVVGVGERVDRFVPVMNIASSPTRFVMDPHEQLAVERELDGTGEVVIGIAHSHPSGDNAPSATDIADAARFDPLGTLLHMVVDPRSGSVRAFRIRDGIVTEALVERQPPAPSARKLS